MIPVKRFMFLSPPKKSTKKRIRQRQSRHFSIGIKIDLLLHNLQYLSFVFNEFKYA